jgi:hypothetical protein
LKSVSPFTGGDEVGEEYEVSPVSDRYQDGKDIVAPHMESIRDKK